MPLGDEVPYNDIVLRWWLVFLLASCAVLGGGPSDALQWSSDARCQTGSEASHGLSDDDASPEGDPSDDDENEGDEGDERDDVDGALRSALAFLPCEPFDVRARLLKKPSSRTISVGECPPFRSSIFRPPIRT